MSYYYCNQHVESCNQGCTNCTNMCSVSWSYANYADSYHSDRMASISLTWNQPALQVDSGIKDISDPKEYVAIFNELKEKINYLVNNKGRNSVSTNDTSATGGSSIITSSSINSLRDTLNSLYSELKKSSSGVSTVPQYKRSQGNNISDLRNSVQSLATNTSGYYLNYLNNSSSSQGSGTIPEYINSVTYTDSSSSQRNSATNSGTSYARYLDYNICTEGIKYS